MAKLIDFKIQAPAEMLDSMIANLRGERNAIHNQLDEVYESIHSLRMERMRGSKIDEELRPLQCLVADVIGILPFSSPILSIM